MTDIFHHYTSIPHCNSNKNRNIPTSSLLVLKGSVWSKQQQEQQEQRSMAYRKAIISAIEDMGDNHLRSSVETIEKHVKANLPSGTEWNHVLFLTTLKAIIEDGDVDVSSNHFTLSPDFKRKRVRSFMTKLQQCPNPPMTYPSFDAGDDNNSPTLRNNDEHLKYKAAKRKVGQNERESPMETA